MKAKFSGVGDWPTSERAGRITNADIEAFRDEDPRAFDEQVMLAQWARDAARFADTIKPDMSGDEIRVATFREFERFSREMFDALKPVGEVRDE